MSLQPQAIPPIPEETARVARALFPEGNRYMRLRMALNGLAQSPVVPVGKLVLLKALITPVLLSMGRPSKPPAPKGKSAASGRVTQDRTVSEVIGIQFGKQDCLACPCRSQCSTAITNPRQLVVRPQAHFEAIQAARHRQQTRAFKERYAIRAGIEGTISEAHASLGLTAKSLHWACQDACLEQPPTGLATSGRRCTAPSPAG